MIDELLRTVLYVLPIILLATPFIGVHLLIECKEMKSTKSVIRGSMIAFKAMLMLSIILVIALTIGRNVHLDFNIRGKLRYINVRPFVQIFFDIYLIFMGNGHYAINIVGNVLMFMPVGFFMCMYLRECKHYKQVTLVSLIIFSLGIESFQILICRGFDINDVILNAIGSYIGADLFSYVSILRSDILADIQICKRDRRKGVHFLLLLNWSIYVLCYYVLFF